LSSGSLINRWQFEVAITKQRFDFNFLKIDRAMERSLLAVVGNKPIALPALDQCHVDFSYEMNAIFHTIARQKQNT
jgi:hypothetical protein